jgi:fructose-bisphosphate aldolase class II
MAFVKVEEIYRKARKGRYGVGGFCAENLEMVQAILTAAEETQSPVAVALWEEDIKAVGPGYLEAIVRYGASQVCVPVGIMLDHGTSFASCMNSILNGHSCVMYDASHEDFDGNVRRMQEVVQVAHQIGVIVEGELGTVRRSFETNGPYAEETVLTDPEMVPIYVRQTGIDAVAISVGTESGIPKEPLVLDFDRLLAISSLTDAYLILHGGSGTAAEDVRRAVDCGVTAFRFASEIRVAYLNALFQTWNELPPDYPDTRLIYQSARRAATEIIKTRMQQLGCAGKAW